MDTIHYQTHTLVDVAYMALKQDITEQRLIPGQKIIIRELHERYGISGTPIKQALNRMIAEGLVISTPRKGIRVREIRWEEIEELMDMRLMIESYYVGHMVERYRQNSHLREKLANNLAEHRQSVERSLNIQDHLRSYSLDQGFHQMLVECSGNKAVMQFYLNLGTHIYAHYIFGRQKKTATLDGVKEHEEMLDALAAGDGARLQQIIRIHIDNAKKKISTSFHSGETCDRPDEAKILI